MRRVQQVFLGLFGGTVVAIASLHVMLGPGAIPGGVPVNATIDSEDRFYAVFFGAYGLAVLWCAREPARRGRFVYALAAVFFAGGLARLVSIARVGPPIDFFLAMTALELAIPPVIAAAQSRISPPPAPPGPA